MLFGDGWVNLQEAQREAFPLQLSSENMSI